jgi:hypothetical protein
MQEIRQRIAMKGTPKHILVTDSMIEIWIPSPTGDSSDSLIFRMECVNNAQAQIIAKAWYQAFNIEV